MEMNLQVATDPELQEQVIRLSQEKRDLHDYAERVTRELRRYQQARPPPPARQEDDLPLPPWATNMQMMSPLLFAYEERITELETVIERSVSLAEQAQVLTKENDALRVELHERTEQLRNAQLMAPVRELRDGGDQPDEVQELYRLSVEQNEALAQQNQLLKLQLEKMQQTLVVTQRQAQDLQTRAVEGTRALAAEKEQTTRTLTFEKESVEKALSAEQERAEVYARQRSAAESRLEEVTGELFEEVRTREQLHSQVEGLQQELQHQRQSLDFYKKSFDERCAMATDEEDRLQADLERSTHNEKEMRKRASFLERELADSNEQLFAARNQGEGAMQEAQHMVRDIESMQKRLRDISAQHEKVQKEVVDKDSQIGDLLLQKDAWTAAEHGFKRQVDRLESRLQSEMNSLQHHRDHEMEKLKSSHAQVLADTQDRLRASEQSSCDLQAKVELSDRKATWESAALERQTSFHTVERDRLKADLEEAQQERLRIERLSDAARQETVKLRTELDATSAEVRESAAKAGRELTVSRTKMQSLENSLSQAKEEFQACEARAKSRGSDFTRLQAEMREERSKAGDLVEVEKEKAQSERRGFERQLQALQGRVRQDEQRAVELLSAQEALRQRLQAELSYEKEALETQVDRLTRENRSLREKSRNVLKALALKQRGAGPAAAGELLGLPGGLAG